MSVTSFRASNNIHHGPKLATSGRAYWVGDIDGNLSEVGADGSLVRQVNRFEEARGSISRDPVELADGGLVIYEGFNSQQITGLGPDLTARWSHPVHSTDALKDPLLVGQQLLVASREDNKHYVRSLDPVTGVENWRRETPYITTSPILTPSGQVVVGCHNGQVHGFELDGTPVIEFQSGGASMIGATREGLILATSDLRDLVGHRPDGGVAFVHSGYPRDSYRVSPVQGKDGTLFVPVSNAETLRALDPETGAVRWELPTPGSGNSELQLGPAGPLYLRVEGGLMVIEPNGSVALDKRDLKFPSEKLAVGPDGSARLAVERGLTAIPAPEGPATSLRSATAQAVGLVAQDPDLAARLEASHLEQPTLADLYGLVRFHPRKVDFLLKVALETPKESLAFLRRLEMEPMAAVIKACESVEEVGPFIAGLQSLATIDDESLEMLSHTLSVHRIATGSESPAGLRLEDGFLRVGGVRLRQRQAG